MTTDDVHRAAPDLAALGRAQTRGEDIRPLRVEPQDDEPANLAGQALADAVYRRHAGRPYHTDVRGTMVVLGVDQSGESVSVPPGFVRDFLPQLTRDLTAAGSR
jgi:hypothetical protein